MGIRYNGRMVRWQDHIAVDPNVLVGKPIVRGTRLSVEFIMGLLARGWSHERILAEYDQLTDDDLLACLAYAQHAVELEQSFPLISP